MSTCLGIYIDKNIIKYAKVSRDNEKITIDAFGIKVYTDAVTAINQIISETYSFKIPISVNISNEAYEYFYMTKLLNKKDIKKAVETEFESICYERKYNYNALETRYTLIDDINDKDKIKVINMSTNKLEITKILQQFEGKNVKVISPISFSIANIAPLKKKENILIVNMEDITTVTTITGEKIYDIKKINKGAEEVLDSINQKENSYLKAYEICKNTTIYTMEGQELQEKENEYLGSIVPTLYAIAEEVKKIINSSLFKINKVYLTGTLSVVNNIDLYFEEILNGTNCQILKPFFIEDTQKINMKDYIEVNSAIGLALQGLGLGIKEANFKKKSFWEQLPTLLTADVSTLTKNKSKSSSKKIINFNSPKIKTWAIRQLSGILLIGIIYTSLSLYIYSGIKDKKNEIAKVTEDINKQIALIKTDQTSVQNKTSEYNNLISNLQKSNDEINEKNSYKNVIPKLLMEIMNIIPKEVQLTQIENTTDRKIIINAQSEKYEQLAYFKALLKSNGVLEPTSVISTEAEKSGNIVKIVIEGELP